MNKKRAGIHIIILLFSGALYGGDQSQEDVPDGKYFYVNEQTKRIFRNYTRNYRVSDNFKKLADDLSAPEYNSLILKENKDDWGEGSPDYIITLVGGDKPMYGLQKNEWDNFAKWHDQQAQAQEQAQQVQTTQTRATPPPSQTSTTSSKQQPSQNPTPSVNSGQQRSEPNTSTKTHDEIKAEIEAEIKAEADAKKKAENAAKSAEALKKIEEKKANGGGNKSGSGGGESSRNSSQGPATGIFNKNQQPQRYQQPQQRPLSMSHKPQVAPNKIGFEGNKFQPTQPIAKTPDATPEAIEALKPRGAVVATLPDTESQYHDDTVKIPRIVTEEITLDHDKRSDPKTKKEKITIYRPETEAEKQMALEALEKQKLESIKESEPISWYMSLYQTVITTAHSWFSSLQSFFNF